jgi:formate/nitrite transporter FocA (FNT family)
LRKGRGHLKTVNLFLSAFLAGIMISIAGIVFLSTDKILGSFLFSIGLLTILFFNLDLYTGKIGYITENENYLELLIIWVGNFIGCIITALCYRNTCKVKTINIETIVELKLNYSIFEILFFSFLCGILIFIAVDIYKKSNEAIMKIVTVVLCIAVFILIGAEHCVADMFYICLANKINIYSISFILFATLGNSLGSIFIHRIINREVIKYEKIDENFCD